MNLLQNNAEQLVIITILLSKIVSNDKLATPHTHIGIHKMATLFVLAHVYVINI